MEELLDPVLELVRLVLAQILDPRPVMAELGRLYGALDHIIVNAVELKREEQEMRRGSRQPLHHVAVELGDRGSDAVAGMDQAGVRAEPAGEIVDRFIAPYGF